MIPWVIGVKAASQRLGEGVLKSGGIRPSSTHLTILVLYYTKDYLSDKIISANLLP